MYVKTDKEIDGRGVTESELTYVILLHPVALCNFDLGIMIPSGATTIGIEVPLLEGSNLTQSHLRMAS
jgi:hypothetical protein